MDPSQFEDAPSRSSTAPLGPSPLSTSTVPLVSALPELTAPRAAGAYLDDEAVVEEDDEEEEEDDDYWDEEDEADQMVERSMGNQLAEVMDQDWDVVSGGEFILFTVSLSIFSTCSSSTEINLFGYDGGIRFHETLQQNETTCSRDARCLTSIHRSESFFRPGRFSRQHRPGF